MKSILDIDTTIENIKQTMSAKTARIARYEKRTRFFKDNCMLKK